MKITAASEAAHHPGYQSGSRYDDVWSREEGICAFCATRVAGSEQHCGGCGRNLTRRSFSYATASSNHVILWVLTSASGFLYLILILADLIQGNSIGLILIHALLGLLFLAVSAGIYLRLFWAWAASIPLLLLTLFLNILQVTSVGTSVIVPAQLEEMSQPALAGSFLQSMISLLYFLLLVAQAGALFWAAVFVPSDFSRRSEPAVARLDRNLANAADYFAAGRRHAQHARWANAVLHWQRAAARAPYNWRYQLALAEAYLQLGFFERSADVLQSATKLAGDAGAADVEQLQRLAQQISVSSRH
jgi:tetratricopeptide (TPR) repeat protein